LIGQRAPEAAAPSSIAKGFGFGDFRPGHYRLPFFAALAFGATFATGPSKMRRPHLRRQIPGLAARVRFLDEIGRELLPAPTSSPCL